MRPSLMWAALRGRWGRRVAETPALGLQPLGLRRDEQEALRPVLEAVSKRLAVDLELREDDAEIVLMDVDYAGRTPPPIVHAARADRPVVLIDPPAAPADRLLAAAQRFERVQLELLQQLKRIQTVRERSPHWAPTTGWSGLDGEAAEPGTAAVSDLASMFDPSFDSELEPDVLSGETPTEAQDVLVQHLLRGLYDDREPVLVAAYGARACLRLDFRTRLALLDAPALQALRVRRELPGPTAQAGPLPDASVHELDEIAWDLGMACGHFALLGAPAHDAWHTALQAVAFDSLERYTRQPRHLELARRLVAGPVTPSELRRHVRIGVTDLRRFLQACLFLGMIRWVA